MGGDAGDKAVGSLVEVAEDDAEEDEGDGGDAVAQVGEAEGEGADEDWGPAVG